MLATCAVLAACSSEQQSTDIPEQEGSSSQALAKPNGTNGDLDYCSEAVKCVSGEGHCESHLNECTGTGITCLVGVGPKFNQPVGNNVCAPSHCANGIKEGNETAVDCGGPCGRCPDACADRPGGVHYVNGGNHFCRGCYCSSGQGDCDSTYECAPGLVCAGNFGLRFGFSDVTDVCVPHHCYNDEHDGALGELGIDCGGPCGTCNLPCPGATAGGADYCSACQCAARKGDCDNDRECAPGLKCLGNQGPRFGWTAATDVCLAPHCGNDLQDAGETGVDCGGDDCGPCLPLCTGPAGADDYCLTCRCTSGQGDCDSNRECAPNLFCTDNVGAAYGFSPGTDVCRPRTCTSAANCPTGFYCSQAGDCRSPNGPCTADIQCDAGKLCRNGTCDCATCSPGCTCGTGGSCDGDEDCTSGLECVAGACAVPIPCDTHGDCPGGHYCNGNGQCGDGDCGSDADCSVGDSCQDGMCGCAPNGAGLCERGDPCMVPSDCQTGMTCGLGEGERYAGPWPNVCLPSSCQGHGPDHPDCGTEDALCGVCPPCGILDGCAPTTLLSFRPPDTTVPGAIEGGFAVTDSGTASYTIPVKVPPGRGDMTPDISLVYDSSIRQELMGEGWTVAGFSYVSRCVRPATPAGSTHWYGTPTQRRGVRGDNPELMPDGSPGPVDQLCLDGQFLARQPSLDADGAEGYTTANDSFQRIRGYDGPGADAKYFKVWTPDGRVLTYGSPTSDEGVVLLNLETRKRRVWALTKVEDPIGNYIEYIYDTNEGGALSPGTVDASGICASDPSLCGTTEIWPERIRYTGSAQHEPTRAIQFGYDTNEIPQRIVGYVAGVQTTRSHILNRIDILIDEEVVLSYVLENVLKDDKKYDLERIWECYPELIDPNTPSAGTRDTCKAPTEFTYQPTSGLGAPIDTNVSFYPSDETPPGEGQFIVWDRDADGRDDIITAEAYRDSLGDVRGGRWVQLSPSSSSPGRLTKSLLPYYQLRAAGLVGQDNWADVYREFAQGGITDIDADGLDDLIEHTQRGQGNFMALRGGGGGAVQTTSDGEHPPMDAPEWMGSEWSAQFIDIDGDGYQDLVKTNSSFPFLGDWRRNMGGGLFKPWDTLVESFSESFYTVNDVDGDGTAEIIMQTPEHPQGRAWTWWYTTEIDVPYPPMIIDDRGAERHQGTLNVDANGDGLKDMLVRTPDENFSDDVPKPVILWTHTGLGYKQAEHVADLTWFEFLTLRAIDYDGDGDEDVLSWSGDSGWRVLLGREGGFDAQQLPAGALATPGAFGSLANNGITPWTGVADLNGDGAKDFLVVTCSNPGEIICTSGAGISAHLGNSAQAHMLVTVTDGVGERTTVTYDDGGDNGYRRVVDLESEPASTRVLNRIDRPLVSSTTTSQRVGEDYVAQGSADYIFTNARVDHAGRGWLGFESRTTTTKDAEGEWKSSVWAAYEELTYLQGHPICFDNPPQGGGCEGVPGADEEPWRYPLAGFPTQIETRYPRVESARAADGDRNLRVHVVNEWELFPEEPSITGRENFVYLSFRRTGFSDYLNQGGEAPESSFTDEWFTPDGAGNVTEHRVGTKNGEALVSSTLTTTLYQPFDEERWLLRLPWHVTVTRDRGLVQTPIGVDIDEHGVRSTHFEFDDYGNLTQVRRSGEVLTTDFIRNEFGNVERVEVYGSTGPKRVTVVDEFDEEDLFPTHITVQPDAASETEPGEPPLAPHTASYDYDYRHGAIVGATDTNGLEETWEYDGFGRLVRHDGRDGSGQTITFSDAELDNTGVLPVAAVLRTTTSHDGGGVSHEDTDSFGRLVRTTSLGIESVNGATINRVQVVQERSYDASGRPHQVARPHAAGDSSQGVTTHTYNALDELIQIERADGKSVFFDRIEVASMDPADAASVTTGGLYDAIVVYSEDAKGAVETRVYDLDGLLISSIDAEGGVVDYQYDAFGAREFINGPLAWTRVTYDAVGRLQKLEDPDRGDHDYTYTPFDELETHTRPGVNGDTTRLTQTLSYDPFGRIKRLENADGVRRWEYDQAENGIGRVSAEYVDAGGTAAIANSATYTYDDRGRLESSTRSLGSASYSVSTTYTLEGRPEVITYPSIGEVPFRVELVNDIETGASLAVRDADEPSRQYWGLVETLQGYLPHVEQVGPAVTTTRSYFPDTGLPQSIVSKVGTSTIQDEHYTFDGNHNLLTRSNGLQAGSLRTFSHDALNRLDQVLDADDEEIERIEYEPTATGNITYKKTVGTYTYDHVSGKPHAVSSVTNGTTYDYDDSGNQITREGGAFVEQYLRYTMFGLPFEISSNTGAQTRVHAFQYTAGGQRLLKEQFLLSDPEDPESERVKQSFRTYIGQLYELRGVCPGGADVNCENAERTHVYRVYGGSGEVAQVHRVEGADETVASEQAYYLHNDQLGSAGLVTAGESTEATAPAPGTVLREQRYTPFGVAEVDVAGADDVSTGFTGHEEDTDVGLVNMQGRLYDAQLGRFLSPDPINPAPGWTQGLNAYSYVLNSPLSLVDPSGFQPIGFANSGPASSSPTPPPEAKVGKGQQSWVFDDAQRRAYVQARRSKQREQPADSSGTRAGAGSGSGSGKATPDAGQPGAGAGTGKGTAQAGATTGEGGSSTSPGEGVQEAMNNARKNASGTSGGGMTAMDHLTTGVGILNFEGPGDGPFKSGGIPGGHCQGAGCVSGAGYQAAWMALTVAGPKLVGKAKAAYTATKSWFSGLGKRVGGLWDSAMDRMSRALADAAPGGSNLRSLKSALNPKNFPLNCGSVAVALDRKMAGAPTSAINTGPLLMKEVAETYGQKGFASYPSAESIGAFIERAGPGARGIVYGHQTGEELGHFFNVVNQNGKAVFLDGSVGSVANTSVYSTFAMVRTN